MFRKFYSYLFRVLGKKKPVWVVNGLIWLFYALILLIIPASLNVSPLYLWSNSMFNFNIMTIIFLSIYCCTITVEIFNQPREDGSELLIFSKPISRWKIINAKFSIFLTYVLINLLVDMIFPLLTLCFGIYDPLTNANGIKLEDLGWIILSILIAGMIVCLFFGSISILISMKANIPVVKVSTICIAIIFELISMIMPVIVKSPASIATDKYGVTMEVSNYYSVKDKKVKSFIMADDGVISDDTVYVNTYELNKDIQKESGLQILNSIDVGGQMASIYQLGSLSGSESADITTYGANSAMKFTIKPNWNIFNVNDPMFSDDFRPMIYPSYSQNEYWCYTIYGVDNERYMIYNAIGCKPTSVFIIDNQINKLKSRFIDTKDLTFVIPEAKQSEQYKDIRNKLIAYVNNTRTSFNEDMNADYENWIYTFLNSTVYDNKTGLECVLGQTYENTDDEEWSIAFGILSMNLVIDLWDYFYGVNDFDTTSFATCLINELNTTHSDKWTLYNEDQVTNEEFVNNKRFLFYDDFLSQYSQNQNNACGRFYSLFKSIKGLNLKNIDGYAKGVVPATTAEFQINTMRNVVPNIKTLRTAYWFDIDRYVTNNDAIVIWFLFSIILFGITFVIYRRTDIK